MRIKNLRPKHRGRHDDIIHVVQLQSRGRERSADIQLYLAKLAARREQKSKHNKRGKLLINTNTVRISK